jgi:SAM-dependent methyltransferase
MPSDSESGPKPLSTILLQKLGEQSARAPWHIRAFPILFGGRAARHKTLVETLQALHYEATVAHAARQKAETHILAEIAAHAETQRTLHAQLRVQEAALNAAAAEANSARMLIGALHGALRASQESADDFKFFYTAAREEDNLRVLRLSRLADENAGNVTALERIAQKLAERLEANRAAAQSETQQVAEECALHRNAVTEQLGELSNGLAMVEANATSAERNLRDRIAAAEAASQTASDRLTGQLSQLNAQLIARLDDATTKLESSGKQTAAKLDDVTTKLESSGKQTAAKLNEVTTKLESAEKQTAAKLDDVTTKLESSGQQTAAKLDAVATKLESSGKQTAAKLDAAEAELKLIGQVVAEEKSAGALRLDEIKALQAGIAQQASETLALGDRAAAARQAAAQQIAEGLAAAAKQQSDISGRLSLVAARLEQVNNGMGYFEDPAAEARFEGFYLAFENRYRGTRELIMERQRVYLSPLANAPIVSAVGKAQFRIIDLGCGRGEWVELLLKEGFTGAVGVDSNSHMAEISEQFHLPVQQGDALAFLRAQPDRSAGAISAFHVVEHVPFPVLLTLLAEARRVLLPGGLLMLETPNAENMLTATQNFRTDPTHRFVLPPLLLSFAVENSGFTDLNPLRLHPYGPEYQLDASTPIGRRFNEFFFSAQDFGLVAKKG